MSKKVILIILIVSVAINLATVVTFMYYWTSEHRPKGLIGPRFPDRFPQWHGGRLKKELQLEKQQIEEIKKVNEDIRMIVQPVREELIKKRHELMLMIQEQEPNQERIELLIREIATLQAEHDTRLFTGILTIKKLLTQQQQDKLGMLFHDLVNPESPNRLPHDPPLPHPPQPPRKPGY